MRCTLTKEDFLESVIRAEKTTGKNHTLPVLSCVLLVVEGDMLTITATNLEVGVQYTVPIKDGQNGSSAVSGAVLAQVVTTLQTGSVITLEAQKGYLVVSGAGSQSKLALQDTEEFPRIPAIDTTQTFSLPAKSFSEAIMSVSYCASTSTIKPELSSIYIHPNGGSLTAVATDSFRLAEKKIVLKNPVSIDPFLIPARSASDVLKFLELAEDTVTVSVTEHQLALTAPNAYITLRLTAGTFPDYTQIIPKTFITEATMVRFDIERVLRRAAVFTDQFNQTTLTINPKKKQCTVHTQHASVGETTDSVPSALTGEELTIRFNQRYLLDSLQSIATDSVVFQFAGQSQPAIIRPIGDTTFLYLVMPMNR